MYKTQIFLENCFETEANLHIILGSFMQLRRLGLSSVVAGFYFIDRGYYMAVRRYEISLLVLKIFHSFATLTPEINTRREISYLRTAM